MYGALPDFDRGDSFGIRLPFTGTACTLTPQGAPPLPVEWKPKANQYFGFLYTVRVLVQFGASKKVLFTLLKQLEVWYGDRGLHTKPQEC